MIARTGFVSNSSSQSFIVATSMYATVFDVARAMIRHRKWRGFRNGEWYSGDDEDLARLDAAEQHGIDPNISIEFPATNGDTYIVRSNDVYEISTCNNDQYYELEGFEIVDDARLRLASFNRYYLRYGVIGHPVSNDPVYCSKHNEHRIELDDKRIICPQCDRDITPQPTYTKPKLTHIVIIPILPSNKTALCMMANQAVTRVLQQHHELVTDNTEYVGRNVIYDLIPDVIESGELLWQTECLEYWVLLDVCKEMGWWIRSLPDTIERIIVLSELHRQEVRARLFSDGSAAASNTRHRQARR